MTELTSYEIERLENEIERLRAENEQLRAENEHLRDLAIEANSTLHRMMRDKGEHP